MLDKTRAVPAILDLATDRAAHGPHHAAALIGRDPQHPGAWVWALAARDVRADGCDIGPVIAVSEHGTVAAIDAPDEDSHVDHLGHQLAHAYVEAAGRLHAIPTRAGDPWVICSGCPTGASDTARPAHRPGPGARLLARVRRALTGSDR